MRKSNIIILSFVAIAFLLSSVFLIKGIGSGSARISLLLLASATISLSIIAFAYSFILELSKKYYTLKDSVIIQMSSTVKKDDAEIGNEELKNQQEAVTSTMAIQLEELKKSFSKNLTFEETSNYMLTNLAHTLELVQGEIYLKPEINAETIQLSANYAYYNPEGKTMEFRIGEGLIGQVAKVGNILTLDNLPTSYMTVASGLGKASPTNLMLAPIKKDDQILGVIEIASFKAFNKQDENFISEAGKQYYEYLMSKKYKTNNSKEIDTNSETENIQSND